MSTTQDTPSRDRLVSARGLHLEGPRGPVYGRTDLDLDAGEVVALVGSQGSGRTALLLTLAGRMDYSGGALTVLGHPLPRGRREVQHHSALAHVSGIDDLDEGLTIGELFDERAGLSVPLWRRPLRRTDRGAVELASVAYGEGHPPAWSTRCWELTPLQDLQTRVLLALVGRPRFLVVDDVDLVRDPSEQRLAWATLRRVADLGTGVVGAATSTVAVPSGVRIVPLAAAEPTATPTADPTGEAVDAAAPALHAVPAPLKEA